MAPSRLPRLMLVLPWSPALPGGVSVVVRNLLAQWRGGRAAVGEAVITDWDADTAGPDAAGEQAFRFGLFGEPTLAGLARAMLGAPRRLRRTAALLAASGAQAVNFHYPGLDALGVALLKQWGVYRGRLLLSFHGTDVRAPATGLERRLWRWLFSRCDGISACSAVLRQRLSREMGVAAERVTVIHNGVDTDLFFPRQGDGAATPYVVSVGSYLPVKGHATLLEAFAQVAGEFAPLRLVIAGMDGPEREGLLARAQALGLADRLECRVGLRPAEVAELVAGAALCVQPSLSESFGMAVIEAGACGVPVAASAVGGHLELLRDGETGVLFPVQDVPACADALRRLLRDRQAAQAMAARFRNEVLARYSWRTCAEAYLALALPEVSRA